MPSYDYKCNICDYKFEAFHAMSAKPLSKCPKCNKLGLIKLISPGALAIVKGTQNPCRGGRNLAEIKERKIAKKQELEKQRKKAKEAEKRNPPWWRSRKDNKIDMNVLKNPEKYIKTGET